MTDATGSPSGFTRREGSKVCVDTTAGWWYVFAATEILFFGTKSVFDLDACNCAELIRSETSALQRHAVGSATGIARSVSFVDSIVQVIRVVMFRTIV